MEILLKYLIVFGVGGFVCFIGQILINKTKMTSARILIIFLLSGVFLEAVGLFDIIAKYAGAGIRIPIIGFGASLAKGAIKGAKHGILDGIIGGLSNVSAGLTAAIVFGFIFAIIFKSHSKKL